MNVLIIEDEELAALRLTKLLAELAPDIQIVNVTSSIETSVEYLQTKPSLDLIFMDIELADGQSFEIFEQTSISTPVIFTTSYDEYAIKAFKVNSIDYLLKPIKQPELAASLHKYQLLNRQPEIPTIQVVAIDSLVEQLRRQNEPAEYRRRFLVRHLSQWLPIEVGEIAFFHSEDRVTLFRTFRGQKYSLDYTLDELDSMLDPTLFFRANRQFIVHVNAVQQIHAYFNHKLKLTLNPCPAEEVLVSRERATDFKKWMGK
ncbi:LytR/AlgR family response regulator transcription factor [Spirosoma oryzicola]|uniref:LytR/AlgR family response regulator transcription factor n=1 Tax=Spirosoma oryzicola TaxID=2898794 RepID=UPI001E5D85CE|nr:LytTR family DNA-binding domain-containing protein [Spirosoma oryzicola]UHG94302.1 LytTR family DNA-binding domain-containing protein [Spirosoma oryzicola]